MRSTVEIASRSSASQSPSCSATRRTHQPSASERLRATPAATSVSRICRSPIRSRVIEYTGTDEDGEKELAAVCLTDVLDDGLSMVYSFYEPDLAAASLGTYVILDHIEIARAAGLPYVYLGYWVPGSAKMAYKARFSALEIYVGGDWRPIGDPDAYSAETHPLSTDPIAEQVARINLPDTRPTKG